MTTPQTIVHRVGSYAELQSALYYANRGFGYVDGQLVRTNSHRIELTQSFDAEKGPVRWTDLPWLNNPDLRLVIEGNGHQINGRDEVSGFHVLSGTVVIQNIFLKDMVAHGGDGGAGISGGGGGAGLGGGLYVGAKATVDVYNSGFRGTTAVGGGGGKADPDYAQGGGGGGLGGNGGVGGYSPAPGVAAINGGGGGGGIGREAIGSQSGESNAPGITGHASPGALFGGGWAGNAGGQRTDFEREFSFAGWSFVTESWTEVTGNLRGGYDGGAGAAGGSPLSGGGGGGSNGGSSAAYYNPETVTLEAFPFANIITPIISGALSFAVPQIGLAIAISELASTLKSNIENDDWSAMAIGALASDVIAVGFAAQSAYRSTKGLLNSEFKAAMDASKGTVAKRVFDTLGRKVVVYAPQVMVSQVVEDDPEIKLTVDSAYNALKLALVGRPPNLPGQAGFVQTVSSAGDGRGVPTVGGDGGWGGGGGGGGAGGGDGGFGGGGGGGGAPSRLFNFIGGDGGFGGGGGGGGINAPGGRGGFGAGDGTDGVFLDPDTGRLHPHISTGGGGLGAGGAIFVEAGGKLTIHAGTQFINNYAQGGLAVNPGRGLGHDIFLAGNQTLALNADRNQTITLRGGVADQAGSDPRYTERANLVVTGEGRIEIGGVNTLGGTISIGTEALGVANQAAAGLARDAGNAFPLQKNGGLLLMDGGSFTPTMTIKAYAGAFLEIGDNVRWGGNLDLGALRSGDPFTIVSDFASIDFNIINFPDAVGTTINLFADPHDGDGLGLIKINGDPKLVSLTSNNQQLAQFAPFGTSQSTPGTLLTILPETQTAYAVSSSRDLSVLLSYAAVDPTAPDLSIDMTGASADHFLLTRGNAGATRLRLADPDFTGTIDFELAAGARGTLTIAASALVPAGDHRYSFNGLIKDFDETGTASIVLEGLRFDSGGSSWSRTPDGIVVRNGVDSVHLRLSGAVPDTFLLVADKSGGTKIFTSAADALFEDATDHFSVRNDAELALVRSIQDVRITLAPGGTGFMQPIGLGTAFLPSTRLTVSTPDVYSPITMQTLGGVVGVLEIDQAAFRPAGDGRFAFTPAIVDFAGLGPNRPGLEDRITRIELSGLAFNSDHAQMGWSLSALPNGGSTLSVTNGDITNILELQGTVPGSVVLGSLPGGGTAVYWSLASAIRAINQFEIEGGRATRFTLLVLGEATSEDMGAINLRSDVSLVIDGVGRGVIDGEGVNRGLIIASGDVTVQNLLFRDTVAQGGDGGFGTFGGGGGGAGLGGAIFVMPDGKLTLDNVSIEDAGARGGRGGDASVDIGPPPGQAFYDFREGRGGGGGGFTTDAGVGSNFVGAPGFGPLDVPGSFGRGGRGSANGFFQVNGNFGAGGGGDNHTAGSGGFGGGGGGSQFASLDEDGGNFPGYQPGTGGWGGGNGSAGGGGGLAAGAGIFVMAGGLVTIRGSTMVGAGEVTGGAGGTGVLEGRAAGGSAGAAHGSGIFIQGSETLRLAPGLGEVLTISGVIADERGVDSSRSGQGALLIDGGTVVLAPVERGVAVANSFSGGISLVSGTLQLASAGAAGSGQIRFGDDWLAERSLVIDIAPQQNATINFTNVISGFDYARETIVLPRFAFSPDTTAEIQGNLLLVSGRSGSVAFQLAEPLFDAPFVLDDGRGGTLISFGTVVPNGTLAAHEDIDFVFTPALLTADYPEFTDLSVTGLVANRGVIDRDSNGVYTLRAQQDHVGPVKLTYTLTNPDGVRITAGKIVNFAAANDAPRGAATFAIPDATEDTPFTITAAALLAGFTDVDGGTLSISSISTEQGSVEDLGNGSYRITPGGDHNGQLVLLYAIADGQGGETIVERTITVRAVNDAPEVPLDGVYLPDGTEDTLYRISAAQLLDQFFDVDGDALSITAFHVIGQSFVRNPDGSFTIEPGPHFNGPVELLFSVSDGTVTLDLGASFVVRSVNDAPVITSLGGGDRADVTVDENASVVTTVTSYDVDDVGFLSYGIVGGADAGRFRIDEVDGRLSFLTAPDFEAPGDADGDNVYEVIVAALDGSASDQQALRVIIRDVDETLVRNGTAAADTLIGTAADERINGLGGADVISGNGGNDTLHGDAGNDRINGGTGNDLLFGGLDSDTLGGDDGDDILSGGPGADILIGGAGIDTASFAESGTGVQVSLATRLGLGGDAAGDRLSGIENLVGSAFADQLRGDGNANRLSGGAGDDLLAGGRGNDTLVAGAGIDVLQGGLEADIFLFDAVHDGAHTVITDMAIGAGDRILFGAGVEISAVRTGFLSTAATVNGINVENSARSLDLVLSLTSATGATQTVTILDAYGFANNSQWEAMLDLDLTYPRQLPTGSALYTIG